MSNAAQQLVDEIMAVKIETGSGIGELTTESELAERVRNSPTRQILPPSESESAQQEMAFGEWVLQIDGQVENQVISMPTHPLFEITDDNMHEKFPSIFGKWQCWDDFGVSFIPETKKWQYVAYMKRWFGLNVCSFLEHIHGNKDDIWGFYMGVDIKFRADEKRFMEHLLVSSCFLIFAMILFAKKRVVFRIFSGINEESKNLNFQWNNLSTFIKQNFMLTKQYMFTMEYQIPWLVVEAIYTYSNLSELLGTPIDELALLCFDDFYLGIHKSKVHNDAIILPLGGFKHLLHFFHWSRTPNGKFHINAKSQSVAPKLMGSFYIPSATDLQLSQTIFEKHSEGSIDVSYSDNMRFSRVLQLGPWHLSPYSTKIYENLLKFEKYYVLCGYSFTGYVACMVCLLQTKEDVQLLREKCIVPSTRNDEKDVLHYVQEFKKMLNDHTLMSHDLDILSTKVMARHERKTTRYYGEFKRRYCSNLWITISVIAGILLFVLTSIQTIYGTLSYYKQ